MPPLKPCFPELVVLTVSLAMIGANGICHGQQLESSDDGRVETRADDRLEGVLEVERIDDSASPLLGDADRQDEAKNGGWDLGLIVSAAYNDNIFLSSANPVGDLVVRITPRIAYVLGNKEGEEGAYVRFDYRPTGFLYVDNGADNRIDQDVTLLTGARGRKTAVDFSGNYRRLGDAIPDTGTQTDRREYALEIRAAYAVKEKVALELAGGAYGTDYDSATLSGSRDQFGELAVRYAYSPKTQVKLAYRVGQARVDGTGDQTFQRLTAQLAWKPSEKISVDLELGAEHRTFDNGSDNYPVGELRFDWEAMEGTKLFVRGYRREEVSAFLTGQNYSISGFAVGVSQRFSDAWLGRLEAGYEKASYSQVSGPGTAGRKDEIYFVRPSVGYEVNDRFRTSFYYQFSKDKSNLAGFGYTNHEVGVSAAYDF
jgi:hypothetical protein